MMEYGSVGLKCYLKNEDNIVARNSKKVVAWQCSDELTLGNRCSPIP